MKLPLNIPYTITDLSKIVSQITPKLQNVDLNSAALGQPCDKADASYLQSNCIYESGASTIK